MIEIREPNPPLAEEQITALEATIGATIPEPYRTFLMTHNGGCPKPNLIDIDGAPFKGTDINVLHGIGTDHETTEISWNLKVRKGCLENKLLPFACDSGGNFFVIPLTDEERGSVYYFNLWSGGRPVDPPEPWFVAPDFQTFLDKIHDWTPEEQAYFDAIQPQFYRAVGMQEQGRKLTTDDITGFEKALGFPLPEMYQSYLKAFNGGIPMPNLINFEGDDFSGTVVTMFLSVDAEQPERDILWHWENLEICKESQSLPICRDGGGCYLMLGLNEECYGQVHYFDAEVDPPKWYFVAKDFDELMDKFHWATREELGEPELVDISVRFSGSRPADEAMASAAAGHETTPRGHVWHRHQDGETLQLVPKDVHKQTGDPQGYGLRWRSS